MAIKLTLCCAVLCYAVLCRAVQLHFAQDSLEKPIEIFHRLKLYADDDPTGQTRKPVVSVSTRGVLLGGTHDTDKFGLEGASLVTVSVPQAAG